MPMIEIQFKGELCKEALTLLVDCAPDGAQEVWVGASMAQERLADIEKLEEDCNGHVQSLWLIANFDGGWRAVNVGHIRNGALILSAPEDCWIE